ncbi:hypothetical protein [Actinoplanes sp. M2I2]|uniref:GAP1-N2 domain-containing protein n=1 Tax=Actinoplanes sp. M2I2 TaxID=1734444 RepID=UPI002020DB83|nr:hypothetical protein [Actinoplanes sp. M2I2]
MAYEFWYMSTSAGLEARSGWQFVAVSAGAGTAMRDAVLPWLRYKAPPDTPIDLVAEDEARLPVAFSYAPSELGLVFAECRPHGEDFMGRPGNFLGHAVLTTPDEIEGLRPIELWQSAWSTATPPARLPDDNLPPAQPALPGTEVDPVRVMSWLRQAGPRAEHFLAALIEAVLPLLGGHRGRIVIVTDEAPDVVRWIAAVSYSLPADLAQRLSFVTYSGDPAIAGTLVVGTTPAVWAAVGGGPAYFAESLEAPATASSIFARSIAQLWASEELRALGELVSMAGSLATVAMPQHHEYAAILGLLSRPGESTADLLRLAGTKAITEALRVGAHHFPDDDWQHRELGVGWTFEAYATVAESAAAAGQQRFAESAVLHCVEAVCRVPARQSRVPRVRSLSAATKDAAAGMLITALNSITSVDELTDLVTLADQLTGVCPESDIRRAAVGCGRRGTVDLVKVLTMPKYPRELILAGVLGGLEEAPTEVMDRVLTPQARLGLEDRDLTATPRIALVVLVDIARRVPKRRIECSRRALALVSAHVSVVSALKHIWEVPPTPENCLEIFGRPGHPRPVPPASPEVLELCSRAWATYAVSGTAPVMLARRLQEFPGAGRPVGAMVDAVLVLGLAALDGTDEREAREGARAIGQWYGAAGPVTARRVLDAVAAWMLQVSPKGVRAVGPSLRAPLAAFASSAPDGPMRKAVDRIDQVNKPRRHLFRRPS